MSQTFCTKCGGTLTPEHKFCAQCGETNPAFGPGAPAPSEGGAGWDMVLDALRKATRGEFDIAGELGHGGMAAVYLAHDIALDKKVAIKVMAPTLMADTTMVDRFRQEARTVAKLEHQNIVTVHAAKQAGGLHFFVMKYIEGRELGDVLQNGSLPLGVAQAILYEIGLALSYAHSAAQPVIHRDVKPSNIMLDARGNAVLTDFGIAKLKGGRSHTMHGAAIGTPQYMSPEQCLAQPVSAASDQYSLGMVAYHMLNGEPPYHGDPLTVMRKQVDDPLPPLERLREGSFPSEARAALDRMLAKEAADRFPNVLEAVRAFGGHPLPPGDPIKEQIVALVKTPDFIPATEVFTTPMSPSPQSSAADLAVSDPSLPTQPMVPPSEVRTPSQADLDAPTAPLQTPSRPLEPPARASASAPAAPPPAAAPSDPGAYRPTEEHVPGTVAVDSMSAAPATVAVPQPIAAATGRALPVKLIAGAVAALAVVVVVAIIVFGGGNDGGSGGPVLALVPSEFGLRVDQSQQLQLAGAAGAGIEWSSGDETIASVDANGRVVAIAAGTAPIVARAGGDSAVAVVNVASADARLAEIALSPSTGQVVVGQTRRFEAEQFDQNGNRLPDEPVAWESANPATATVTDDGTVRGVAAGQTQIRASSGGISSTATIRVLEPEPVATGNRDTPAAPRVIVASVEVNPRTINLEVGQSRRIDARALDDGGRRLDRTVSWRTQNDAIARVTTSGRVTAVGAGETRVLASAEGAEGWARIFVTQPAPAVKPPVAVETPRDTARAVERPVERRDTARTPAVRDTVKPPAPRDRVTPAQPPEPAVAPFTGLAAGGSHTCVVDGGGASWCWGRNAESQVQAGAGERVARPAAHAGSAESLVAGGKHTCALQGGRLSCWGRNSDGQLGSSDRSATTSAVTSTRFSMVSLGADHSCGITSGGEAFCWGKNDRGQLGDGSTSRRTEPKAVSSDQRFIQIVAGGRHSCGLTRAGEAICWGDNWSGQVGSSMLQSLPSPTGVSGDARFTQLAAGTEFTCGIVRDGTAYCWGKNNAGQLGDGSTRQRPSPSQVRATGLTAIVAGGEHACGLDRQGRAVCWGRGREGQLGTGQTGNRDEPTPVSGNYRFRVLAAGDRHTCGLTTDGQVLCWGANGSGQLGSGGTQASRVPVAIPVRQ